MSLLQLLYYPDDRLRKIARPVENVKDILHLVEMMLCLMYKKGGLGLAATQVDIHLRVIVIDVSDNKTHPLVLINPEFLEKSGKTGIYEGCLSIPNQRSFVPRAKRIKIRALDSYGNRFYLEANDLLAICIQHEMDHLIGKLFIDYISPFKKNRTIKKKFSNTRH